MRHEGEEQTFSDRLAGVYRFNGLLKWMKGGYTVTCILTTVDSVAARTTRTALLFYIVWSRLTMPRKL